MGLLRRHADAMARGSGTAAYQFAIEVDERIDAISRVLGPLATRFQDNPSVAPVAAPPSSAEFDVEPLDGKFKVSITNPQDILAQSPQVRRLQIANGGNPTLTPILHNLQSATDTNFNNSSGVVDYGVSSQLSYEIHTPNATLFWRLRSSFDGSNWNDWQLFTDPDVCGPVAVSSGFERSTSVAPRSVLNTNNATVDSVDAGSNATIRIYGSGGVGSSYTRFDGQGNQITTAGASILGASYTTQYAVVLNSSLVHLAFPTATQYLQTIADAFFYIATVTTVAAGGGGGSSGGGGSTGGGTTTGGGNKLPRL
jgi:hypothetical protein